MKLLTNEQIKALNIQPATCVDWVREIFLLKKTAQLPAKISLHPQGTDFFNTMPCIVPTHDGQLIYSVKVVRRIAGATPALTSDLLLYDARTGDLLAMMDADWITCMRTGAVATLAAQTLRKSTTRTYGFVGLGNTARATLLCLLESEPDTQHHVLLLKYKDQATLFQQRFAAYKNVHFTVVEKMEEMVTASDVIFSCITNADSLLCDDDRLFPEGILVIPVHTKGFQNCDLFFDKVFGDDRAHLHGFRYFDRFKSFSELTDVLSNTVAGRENDAERILSYNIGLGLHDAVFAYKIYGSLKDKASDDIVIPRETEKFWL